MPLNDLSAGEASANLRSNLLSMWPDARGRNNRMGFYAPCAPRPGFSVAKSDLIFTSGSCFARNIERELIRHGFRLIRPDDPDLSKELINKYVSRSVLNEMRWGLGIAPFPQDSLIDLGDGLWHDPHLHPSAQEPAPLARVLARRAEIDRMVSRLPQARIVILTLGLVETWYDSRTDCWLNGIPPAAARAAEPDRYRFLRQSFRDITEDLEAIHDLLRRHGHPDFKIVLTVSPVAFKATQTGQDGVAANTYSKSVLRAAAEEFSERHANVDYFPSFEMVTLSDRCVAYSPDNIHVQESMVARVMRAFVTSYTEGGDATPAQDAEKTQPALTAYRLAARQAFADGEPMLAARLLQQIEASGGDGETRQDKADFQQELGVALAHCSTQKKLVAGYAVKCFHKALKLDPVAGRAAAIARTLHACGFAEHETFAARAEELAAAG